MTDRQFSFVCSVIGAVVLVALAALIGYAVQQGIVSDGRRLQ